MFFFWFLISYSAVFTKEIAIKKENMASRPQYRPREYVTRDALQNAQAAQPAAAPPAPIIRDAIRGSLFGVAIGDAIGTTVEFAQRGSFPPVQDMVGEGPFHLKKGQWTDDTSMMLCLAESLIVHGGKHNAADQLQRYRQWFLRGHLSSNGFAFDIGHLTRKALLACDPTTVGENKLSEEDLKSAPNGSLMRMAAVPLLLCSKELQQAQLEAAQLAVQQSLTTHPHVLCQDACRLMSVLVLRAIDARLKPPVADKTSNKKQWLVLDQAGAQTYSPAIRDIALGTYLSKEAKDIKTSPYVVETLEAVLWAFSKTASFEEGCLLVVNLGGDADTTGAIYGMLAGAFYGYQALPPGWVQPLALRPVIDATAEELVRLSLPNASRVPSPKYLAICTALYNLESLYRLIIEPHAESELEQADVQKLQAAMRDEHVVFLQSPAMSTYLRQCTDETDLKQVREWLTDLCLGFVEGRLPTCAPTASAVTTTTNGDAVDAAEPAF